MKARPGEEGSRRQGFKELRDFFFSISMGNAWENYLIP